MKARKSSDPDWRPITPEKVAQWVEALEKGHAWPGFLSQLTEHYRALYEKAHHSEAVAEKAQLSLFQ